MLYITGYYIPLDYPGEPVPTRWQKIKSWFKPVVFKSESHGADYVRYITIEHGYKLKRGKLKEVSKKIVNSEDLREHNKRTGVGVD